MRKLFGDRHHVGFAGQAASDRQIERLVSSHAAILVSGSRTALSHDRLGVERRRSAL